MANTILQTVGATSGAAGTIAATFPGACTPGSIIVACVGSEGATQATITVADNGNAGNYTDDSGLCTGATQMTTSTVTMQSKANTSSAALTVTATLATATGGARDIYLYEISGPPSSSYVDVASGKVEDTPAGTSATTNITTTTANTTIIAFQLANNGTLTAGTNFTLNRFSSNFFSVGNEQWADSGAAGVIAVAFTNSAAGQPFLMTVVAYKATAAVGSTLFKGVIGGGIGGKKMVIGC